MSQFKRREKRGSGMDSKRAQAGRPEGGRGNEGEISQLLDAKKKKSS